MAGKRRPKLEVTVSHTVNGHRLIGEKRAGRWTWKCPSWPALAEQHAGCEDSGPVVEEFTRRAMGRGEAGGDVPATACGS